MDASIPQLGVEIPSVDQVAVVVEDLYDAMDRFGALLGVEPWTVYRFEAPDHTETTYRGEEVEFGMLLALSNPGGPDVELIEPTRGPNIYRDHLDEHGEGLHHVACFSWDEAETYEVVDRFVEAGIPILQSGNFVGTEYWYFDTADELNGLVFETAIRRNVGDRDPEEVYRPGA